MSDYKNERQRILKDLTFAASEIYTGKDKQSRILEGLAIRVADEIQKMRMEDFENIYNEFAYINDGAFLYERTPRNDALPRNRRIMRLTYIYCNSGAMEHSTAKKVDQDTISDIAKKTVMFYV
jgi:hypothetical protein